METNKIQRFFSELYYRIRDVYYSVRCWFRHCCNKPYFNFYKTALMAYPFDFSYMYEVELAQLKAMEKYYENAKITTEETYASILKYIRLLISMLNIIRNETDYFHYDREMEFRKCEDSDLYELVDIGDYHCDVVVNIRNIDRFVHDDRMKDFILNKYRHELYIMKAKYLYHKIRYEHMESFWD